MVTKLQQVKLHDLGLIHYEQAFDLQKKLQQGLITSKRSTKKAPDHHHLLFCHHYPVYTIGKSGSADHLLYSEEELKQRAIDLYNTNRGGDITYHGPGQLIVYPIFDLDYFFTDVHKYIRLLEQVVIQTLAEYDLAASRYDGYTGVWMRDEKQDRKICAIGVHLSRWVSMHGFALNVNTELSFFKGIVPCGIQEEHTSVTSMAEEMRRQINMNHLKEKVATNFAQVFDFQFN